MKWSVKAAGTLALAAGLLWALAAHAGVGVCQKCGHEVGAEGGACLHCGASPEPAGTAAQPGIETDSVPAEEGRLRYLSASLVEAEFEMARTNAAEGRLEVASLFLRNAAALDQLTDPAATNGLGSRALDMLKRLNAVPEGESTTCPACRGEGRGTMTVTGLDGKVTRTPIVGQPCPVCRGSGQVSRRSGLKSARLARRTALPDYTAIQRSRKYVPVGRAWVPLDVEPRLSPRQVVMLRRAVPAPCQACVGFGRVDCKGCDGAGLVDCPEKGCEQGKVEGTFDASLTKMKITRREKCRTCDGKGSVVCPACEGVSSTVCAKCEGSGEAQECSRCSGQGYTACRRCGGAGQQDDKPCRACRGEKVIVCSVCNGDGRKP